MKWIKRGNDVFNHLRTYPTNRESHPVITSGGIGSRLAVIFVSPLPLNAKFSNPEAMLGMVPVADGHERVLNQAGSGVGLSMLMLNALAQEA